MGDIVVGTCSWADKTMIEAWYPHSVRTAEQRLRYYASRFDTVEVDSPFYAIPRPELARTWVERTPPGFTFHVKAYGMLTGHDVDLHALHPELREAAYDYQITNRGRLRNPSPKMLERAFELFTDSIRPLYDAGKMGGVLMQYPPWFTAADAESRRRNMFTIERDAEMLSPYPVFVEFRHASWAEGDNLARTLRFLKERDLTFVAVDAPTVATGNAMPPVSAVTGTYGYVRFHGRNAGTWSTRSASASDRFDYLYTPDELAEWIEPIESLAAETERTWVMFNNCKHDYAPRNAKDMAAILGEAVAERKGGVATGEPVEEGFGDDEAAPADTRDHKFDTGRLF